MTDKGEVYMLTNRVSSLEVGHAKLQTSYEHMATGIEGLTDAVKELTATMNKNKGAAGVFMFLAGGGGLAGIIALFKQLMN